MVRPAETSIFLNPAAFTPADYFLDKNFKKGQSGILAWERQNALSRILGAIRAFAGREPDDDVAANVDLPDLLNSLNDAELTLLRDGLQQIVREMSAACRFRSVVEHQVDRCDQELESASF